ncbi:MAG: kelch repeat-containing protein, partial [Proteiniphilum sp.]
SASGKNKLMYSENFGLDWVETAENQLFPENFTQRTSASVITDEDNYIWIFGGISGTQTQLADIWRGRLNKFDTN